MLLSPSPKTKTYQSKAYLFKFGLEDGECLLILFAAGDIETITLEDFRGETDP